VTDFVSISFREDSFLWLEISKNDNNLDIQRAVFQKLPFFISHQSLNESQSVHHITDNLQKIIKTNKLDNKSVYLSLPPRFAIIKNLPAVENLPQNGLESLVNFEFEKFWDESRQKYHIYLPDKQSAKENNSVLTVAIRTKVLDFFNEIFSNLNIEPDYITLSCFPVEELSKLFFPSATGQSLLLGWHRRGFDAIMTENDRFLSYRFQNYNEKLDPIEKVTEFDLANAFTNLLAEIQHPQILDEPIQKIQAIYNFGYYFKPEWLDFMRSRVQIPINLFNFDVSSNFTLKISDAKINPDQVFKYIEALSTVFS
jgi:hypothetical protein